MNEQEKSNLKKKIRVIGMTNALNLAGSMNNLGMSTGALSEKTADLKKEVNLAAGLSAKGKTRNPNYKGNKSKMRPSTTIGRVLNNKGSVIFSGLNVRGQESKPHKLHGQLNRAIRVNVPLKDGSGFIQKLEKVKIALQKGLIKTA